MKHKWPWHVYKWLLFWLSLIGFETRYCWSCWELGTQFWLSLIGFETKLPAWFRCHTLILTFPYRVWNTYSLLFIVLLYVILTFPYRVWNIAQLYTSIHTDNILTFPYRVWNWFFFSFSCCWWSLFWLSLIGFETNNDSVQWHTGTILTFPYRVWNVPLGYDSINRVFILTFPYRVWNNVFHTQLVFSFYFDFPL